MRNIDRYSAETDMSSNLSKRLTKRDLALDKVIAILVLCVGIGFIVSFIVLKRYDVSLPGILLVSPLLYLLLRKRLSTGEELPQFGLGNRVRSLSHIIFIISLSLSIWLLWSNLYYRPPIYFILWSVATVCIILDIFALNETKSSHTTIALFKIIVLSVTIYAGMYYQFSGIYGVDPWAHNEWIQETVALGHITEGQFRSNSYFLFPVFHLAGAIMQIVTGLSTYSSVFLTTGVMMAVSCLFVFLIGRKLGNAKVGLLAALIVPLTADAIERATAIIPMSLGFCFFLGIMYFAFCSDRKRVPDSLLVIFLSITLILTHTVAALVTLLSLIAIFAGIKVYEQINKPAILYQAVSLTLITFFAVVMIMYWMLTPSGAASFFNITLQRLVNALSLETQFMLTAPLPATNVPYAVSILDKGGYLLLLALAIIGALIYLHPQNRTGTRITLISIAAVLIVLPYSFSLFALQNILPWRWILFLYVPLSILAVQGLSGISNLVKGSVGKLGMVMLVTLAIIFMMITNSTANDDSPQVFNGAIRGGYTQSEITAIKTLSDIGGGLPITDRYYGYIFPYVAGYDEYRDMVQGENKIFVHRNYYLHHAEWNQRYMTAIHPVGIRSAEIKDMLISDYMKEQEIDRCPLIYNNENVKVYAITSIK